MSLPTLFDLCVPREDVQRGSIAESDFAADLAQVLRGEAPPDYCDPARFFANTHPTHGLKTLLKAVCQRLTASSEQISPIFRLDTQYGGGKTHALIALAHAARGMSGVSNIAEFLPSDLVPHETVRIAAPDGENADPSNGRAMGEGVRAYTLWGEIAYALAGRAGYERVQNSDQAGVAPGAETVRELTARIVLTDKDTVCAWLDRAARQCRRVMLYLWPHHSLRRPLTIPEPTRGRGTPRRWSPVTPAMAAGMTDHIWTTAELLSYRVPAEFIDQLPKLEKVFPDFVEIHHSN